MLTKSPARERYDSVVGECTSIRESKIECWEITVIGMFFQQQRACPMEKGGRRDGLERTGRRGGRDMPARSRGDRLSDRADRSWSGDFQLPVGSVKSVSKQEGQCSFQAGQDHGSSAAWRRPYKASGRPTLRSQFTSAPCLVVRG